MNKLRPISNFRRLPQSLNRAISHRALPSRVAVLEAPFHDADIQEFIKLTENLKIPLAFHAPLTNAQPNFLPAQEKWFTGIQDASSSSDPANPGPLSSYLSEFFYHPFPYELMSPQPLSNPVSDQQDAICLFLSWLSTQTSPQETLLLNSLVPIQSTFLKPPNSPPSFLQFHAPLSLLLSAVAFNRSFPNTPLRQLYIAQSPISDLPPKLAADLPTPHIVANSGKGDIYASSIWLGLEPTYTPLHRDPNPNLFCQLHGVKVVRLVKPAAGDALFRNVQTKLGRSGSSRIRLADMMYGPERELLHEMVWKDGEAHDAEMFEARVGPGDALFIPMGWWHSVRSEGEGGSLNASVNWWFR